MVNFRRVITFLYHNNLYSFLDINIKSFHLIFKSLFNSGQLKLLIFISYHLKFKIKNFKLIYTITKNFFLIKQNTYYF